MNDSIPASLARESMLARSTLPFAVVGIGASAGGIPALTACLKALPPNGGMAFVIVMHLSPDQASSLATLLQAATSMAVELVDSTRRIDVNRVYVAAPGKLLTLNDSYISVANLVRVNGDPVTIDLFFRSMAIVHRERCFAVVLSGCGSDGSVGISRIKEEGGVTLVQSPDEAEFGDMPRAAIATGMVDWVLPVEALAAKLAVLWDNAQRIQLPPADALRPVSGPFADPDTSQAAEHALREVLVTLRTRTGHDFRNYKRATVLRRIERRMQVTVKADLPSYRDHLQSEPREAQALLQDLLIGVTNFFRDADSFEALRRDVLPGLLAETLLQPAGFRGWIAGCSTGEEAYSIAMLLCELTHALPEPPAIHLFATDIDDAAIGAARLGRYPSAIETDVSPARLRRFFDRDNDRYGIRKEVREKIMFAAHNILRDPPFSRLHLISCRNLLIYLERGVHAQVLELFHLALLPGGYLFLGSAESADADAQLFSPVDKKNGIFRANIVSRTRRYVPTVFDVESRRRDLSRLELPSTEAPVSIASLHHQLMQKHALPSVLIDEGGSVVHLADGASRYLHYAAGAPSHLLLSLVQPELRLTLQSALLQASQAGRSVASRRVRVGNMGRQVFVTMTVHPVSRPDAQGALTMVMFDEADDPDGADTAPDADGQDPALVHLETELRTIRSQLQTTTEQSNVSTQELKASNEELQAINEELRSTTEELETSKEELQSINEELLTVNHELKAKVDETARINDDLQNLIASTDIATVFVDRTMGIKRFTPQATRLFNLIPSDVGRSLLDITHHLDHDRLDNDAAEAFRTLRMIEREVRGDDGRWYLARVLPYRTAEDRIDGAVLTFIDITVRRRAEESMRLVTESTMDYAILTTDIGGVISTWNKGAERMFGQREEEALGQSIAMIFLPEDRAAGVVEEEMRQALAEGRAEDDRWHLRKDGSRFFCSGITTPLYDHGRHCGFGKISRDMTGPELAHARSESQLRQEARRRAEAQASSQMKDEFFAVLAHELKNPLNLIQLNADLLSHLPESRDLPAVARVARTIRGAVGSQAQIIDDLFDLSRLATGKLVLRRAPVDWGATVRTIADAVGANAMAKGVAFGLDLAEEPVVIDADAVRIEQIVWNLLTNAIKFTPAGGRVDVRLWREADWGCMDVLDTGRGIAGEALPHVFDMYAQGESGTAKRYGGLGIGLALVRQLVQAHGGEVVAESAGLDTGARFSVKLPMPERSGWPPEAGAREAPLLEGMKVLIVDADAEAIEALRQLLELAGAEVAACRSGEEALRAAGVQPFDLTISDLSLPGMDGYELREQLQGLRPEGPVIALSGLSRPSDLSRVRDAGFAAHLTKPVLLERLIDTVHKLNRRAAA